MKIGYARVSTIEQNLDAQIDALRKEGCEQIFSEKASGGRKDRRELERCLSLLREGDTLVVSKLDRLGRTVRQLIELIEDFKKRHIHFKCLSDPIDTSSATGEFFFLVMGAFAQLEKNLIRERTRTGLESARARGRTGGRPESISRDKKEAAYELYNANDKTVDEIAALLGMSRMTVYRYIQKKGALDAKTTTTVC